MATRKPSLKIPKAIGTSPYDPTKQVEGYKKRFEAANLPEGKTDSRNFLEKAFNVRPNQNVLFDIEFLRKY